MEGDAEYTQMSLAAHAGEVKRRTGVRSTLSVPTGSPQAPRSGVFPASEPQWGEQEYLSPQPTPPGLRIVHCTIGHLCILYRNSINYTLLITHYYSYTLHLLFAGKKKNAYLCRLIVHNLFIHST